MTRRLIGFALALGLLSGVVAGCATQPTARGMAESQREIDEANRKAGIVQDPM
jgi:outer membrane lipoprotein-sorting protein